MANHDRTTKQKPTVTTLFGETLEELPCLKDRYVSNPFNVLDTRQGDWNRSRKKWRQFLCIGDVGIQGEEIEENKAFDKFNAGQGIAKTKIAEEAVFDPVLLETLADWYCPPGGRIIDPFNGSHISGCLFSYLGYTYTGIDIRQKIVDQNFKKLAEVNQKNGTELTPDWRCGDSNVLLDDLIFEPEYDMFNSCPPYGNLVKYSKDNPIKGDISLEDDYDKFMVLYESICKKACFILKSGGYACITLGDFRDKKTGELNGFLPDTVNIFRRIGMKYYNEVPLIGAFGSAAMRAKGTFERGDGKLVNVHQTVLIFKKP